MMNNEVLSRVKETEERCKKLTLELGSRIEGTKKLKEEVREKKSHIVTLEEKLVMKEANMKQWKEIAAEHALIGGSEKYVQILRIAYEGWETKIQELKEEVSCKCNPTTQ